MQYRYVLQGDRCDRHPYCHPRGTCRGAGRGSASSGPITIYNFAKVNDELLPRGAAIGEHYADLAAIGVKTVINLTNDVDGRQEEKEMVEKLGMTLSAHPDEDAQAAHRCGNHDLHGCRRGRRRCIVHCVGGRHRTGVMTAVYRMTKDRLTGEQAFKEMKQYKYGPDFLHPEFKKFVYKYQPKATAAAVATSSSQQ